MEIKKLKKKDISIEAIKENVGIAIDDESERAERDSELCREYQSGNDSVFDEIYSNYKYMVKACAHSFFLTNGDSEDLLQEGVIGLLKASKSYKDDMGTTFSSYAYTCIQNSIYTAIKSANSQKNKPLTGYISLNSKPTDIFASIKDPEEEIISRENEKELWISIRKELSTFEILVLTLYLEGLSYGEIGEKINKEVKSVDNALQRIKRKISNILLLRRK